MDEKVPLTQMIARKLQEMIRSGELAPGQKIPSQRVLARQLNVSRPSLREALLTLETLGLVRTLPARGSFVVDPDDTDASPPRTWRYDDTYRIEDVFQTRLLIEAELCRLAAPALDREALDTLEQANEEFATAWQRGDLMAHVEADLRFHRGIAETCGNAMLRRLYQSVREMLNESQRQPIPHTEPERMAQSIAEHRAILDALQRGDGDRAAQAMREHIGNTARCAGVSLV